MKALMHVTIENISPTGKNDSSDRLVAGAGEIE